MTTHPTVRRARRGGNAIEFALTLPLFLMVVVGLMDYGYLFAMQAGIDNAVAMACREGAMEDPGLGPTLPVDTAESQLDLRAAIFCGGVSCTKSVSDLQTGVYEVPNRTLRCEITRPMNPLVGFLPAAMYPATINSVSYYRFEWQRK
jgi:hypothetical protein